MDDAIEGVRKMLQNFTFNEDAQKDVCLRMIYHAGANIFDHAYGNGFDFPDPLKKGFVAVRLFSTKGFHQILRHAPQEIKKYMEYLRSDGETISIVVADAGKGIWRALDPSKKMSELECIKEAFKKGISSKTVKDSSDPKRGLGLYRVQKFINEQKGYLEIRSGRSRYIMIPKEVCMIHGIYPDDLSIDGKLEEFPGVQFRIYIPLNACAKKEKQLFMFDEGYLWNRNSNS
ncbi:MAG: hypothetical protein H8E17_09570 [Deltaproteobacteria bacterium]|nr:hypothetical protein [Deltaproteobacteria bacterium]